MRASRPCGAQQQQQWRSQHQWRSSSGQGFGTRRRAAAPPKLQQCSALAVRDVPHAGGLGGVDIALSSSAEPASSEPPILPQKGSRPSLLAGLDASPELVAIGLVYLVQGVLELATLAQTYHLKDELHADPAHIAMVLSLTGIPWCLKPLVGFVSDTVPLFGFRRKSYLMLASLAGAASFAFMGQGPASAVGFLAAMVLSNSASAVSDVVVDSMVVERARGESQASAGSLQSLCWASYAIAQVATASLSGTLVQEYGPRYVFQMMAAFPLLVGAAAVILEEQPVAKLSAPTAPLSAPTAGTSTSEASTAPSSSPFSSFSSSASIARAMELPAAASSSSTASHAADASSLPNASSNKSSSDSAVSRHMSALWEALSRPDVCMPLAFLLMLSSTPCADTAMFSYQTEVLHFLPTFLGQVQLVAACASFLGVIVYNTSLKHVPVRSLMLWGTLLAALLQGSQLVLVSGAHRAWGLDDHAFVLGGSLVMDVVQNVLSMPMMVLAARMCPAGLEATCFATIMSLCNLADGVRLLGGAGLCALLGVTNDDFSNMPALLAICNASLLLPLFFLHLIPDKLNDANSDSSATATVATVAASATTATTATTASHSDLSSSSPETAEPVFAPALASAHHGSSGLTRSASGGSGASAAGGATASLLWSSPSGSANWTPEQEAALAMAEVALLVQPGAHAVHRHLSALPLQSLSGSAPPAPPATHSPFAAFQPVGDGNADTAAPVPAASLLAPTSTGHAARQHTHHHRRHDQHHHHAHHHPHQHPHPQQQQHQPQYQGLQQLLQPGGPRIAARYQAQRALRYQRRHQARQRGLQLAAGQRYAEDCLHGQCGLLAEDGLSVWGVEAEEAAGAAAVDMETKEVEMAVARAA